LILYGAEAHAAIKQTAYDLIELGYTVHLVVDAVTSMKIHDRNIAIENLKSVGVKMTSFESVLYEL